MTRINHREDRNVDRKGTQEEVGSDTEISNIVHRVADIQGEHR